MSKNIDGGCLHVKARRGQISFSREFDLQVMEEDHSVASRVLFGVRREAIRPR